MQENKIYSAAGLWKDFDPEILELDTSVISEEASDGGFIRKRVRFNGRETESGETSRVLALLVYKDTNSQLPALVLVPPSGEPVNENDALYWADKGYAVIAPDLAGESDSDEFTVYPEEIKYANFIHSGRYFTHCDFTAKETCWYEWAVNIRRAITYVNGLKFVQKNNIVLLGKRDGAIVACMAGAFDKRLKACAVLSGSCWLDDAEKTDGEERDRWFAGIAPQSYVMYMNIPFYICTGANSKQADIDKIFQALQTMPRDVPKAMLFIPDIDGDGNGESFINLEKWLRLIKAGNKNPVSPAAEFEIRDRKLFINVSARENESVKDVKIFFARGNSGRCARYWAEKPASALGGNKYTALAEVVPGGGTAYCFSNITFKNGFAMSSNIAAIDESRLTEADVEFSALSKLLYKGSSDEMPFICYDPEECGGNLSGKQKITVKAGPFDIKGAAGTALSTFALSDPKYIKEKSSMLAFDVYSENPQVLKIHYIRNFGEPLQKIFHATVKLLGGSLWQKISLSPADFHSSEDHPPQNWDECQVLSFTAENEIILNNVLFT